MCYAYVGIRGISNDSAFVVSNDVAVDFVANFLSKRDAIFVEVFENCVFVLVVAISAKMNFVFVAWLLCSFCDFFVEFITDLLNPFTDGKSDYKTCFSFDVKVCIRITLFSV